MKIRAGDFAHAVFFIASSSRPWIESSRGRMIRIAALALWTASQAVGGQFAATHTFDNDRSGAAPGGFELAALRQDSPGTWVVRREGANGALLHDADPAAKGYALALTPDILPADVEASVRLRLGSGTRAAGLVWRYTDAGHYYAAVLDLDRSEIVLFRVTDGNRVFLESEDGLELDPAAWHTLKIVQDGSRIAVSLGGIRVFDERDRRSDRVAGQGKIGVIAAGGSEAWFDDIRIESGRSRRR
jgi:hypothetical protein